METLRKLPVTGFNRTLNAQETRPLIGKEEYEIIPNTTPEISSRLLELKKLFGKETARAVAFQLHNNNADRYSMKRPASAYFTELDKKLIIEWGEIDAQGDGKLHTFLNRSVDYTKRVKTGGTVRSGHIGYINLPQAGTLRVALLDSLWSEKTISPVNPEHNIVTTLSHNGILPLTSDGYPAQISNS